MEIDTTGHVHVGENTVDDSIDPNAVIGFLASPIDDTYEPVDLGRSGWPDVLEDGTPVAKVMLRRVFLPQDQIKRNASQVQKAFAAATETGALEFIDNPTRLEIDGKVFTSVKGIAARAPLKVAQALEQELHSAATFFMACPGNKGGITLFPKAQPVIPQ